MNKPSLFLLSLLSLLFSWSCKKTSDPAPVPTQTTNFPFEVQLVYPLANSSKPELEVSPNGLLKMIFRLSANQRITVVDFLTKDQEQGEKSLRGYPYVVDFSTESQTPQNATFQFLGYNNTYLTQTIRIPNYAKDSVVLTVKMIQEDLSSRSMKLVLKVKQNLGFQISGVSLNQLGFLGNPLTMYAGDFIGSFSGSVNTPGVLTKVTAALWVDEVKTSATVIPFVKNNYDDYDDVYGSGSPVFSHYFNFTASNTRSMLPIRKEYDGKNIRVRITALDQLGDSTSLDVPIRIGTRNILEAGPFRLGSVRSPDYGQFLYTVNSAPLVSSNPDENFSQYDPFSVIGFYHQNGAHRLGSLAWIYANRSSLGYTFPGPYFSKVYNSYFRKVPESFEAVDALYLDTMRLDATAPEVLSVLPNDVVVFSSSQNRLQRGVLKVHSIAPGDSGSVLLSCKYQIR
jgi:hypothetical protein